MFGWDEAQDAHQQAYGGEHEGKLSHELLAGGAAFEGMKLFEDHQRKEGKPVSHAFAKEVLMGFVGGEVDKLVETKGRDEYDRERAHRHARETAENMYDQHYNDYHGADEYNPDKYGRSDRLSYNDYDRNDNRDYGGSYDRNYDRNY